MVGRVIISGGSIAGLCAAVALRRAGWRVDVFERSGVELAGRGAGIVTHPELVAALTEIGAQVDDLGVRVTERVAFDKTGAAIARLPFAQVVTSWDRVHQILRALVPDARHHLGGSVTGYTDNGSSVTAHLADGRDETADLLIGADGFRSAVRGRMLPEVLPSYSGYVVWRALAHEADLPMAVREAVFPAFGFYAPAGTQIIGYPIAGPGNDLRPGQRRYNFVWYSPVPARQLGDMLVDATGRRHAVSIPPPLVRDEIVRRAVEEEAREMLPLPFVQILEQSERPFFTPIYDHASPVMAAGRVALVGDAACVARPHVGMGVTKAVCDGLALTRQLTAHGGDVIAGLAAYSDERVPASHKAYARARELGGYIFDDSIANTDGRGNPRLDEIMRTTAVAVT
ncbi:FAD binding domain-containing protein [Roseisalinus antarcticus]|uniref:6-hydroxynicotinate 3-monooxygenase n=1 Tax=Roseisalinus antarcticus TaxID=254357 RepID=A0A1Y5TZJ7_9RHOB|nr:FAD-dependent monooxygenase [Roseisalinus antarcticus]SLN76788.1 6-hydroxynicotinate 3-monooxygenase precursor [Roseisalinus antarcticus]